MAEQPISKDGNGGKSPPAKKRRTQGLTPESQSSAKSTQTNKSSNAKDVTDKTKLGKFQLGSIAAALDSAAWADVYRRVDREVER